jgi:hypothetical protein
VVRSRQPIWTWSRCDLDRDELTPVDELPASTADTFWFQIDGNVYASQTNDDNSQTTLINLTADGGSSASSLPGFLQNIARVR